MTDQAIADPTTSTATGRTPPSVRLPAFVQGVGLTVFRRGAMRYWFRRHGPVFEFRVPFFGRCVAVSDPTLVRVVCTAGTDVLTNYQPNLSTFFGPGSIFALDGERHHDRRRLLGPAFHGRSLGEHEAVIVEETLRECATWPNGEEFRILEPMKRITLNVILRTVFGADGEELVALREIVPRYAEFGSAMVKFMPVPTLRAWRSSPWSRMDRVRNVFDGIIETLIDKAEADPGLDRRTDVLAMLLRGRETSGMSRRDVCDELVTLIGAGHETTTSALSWTFERLRRHPDVLAELTEEVAAGGGDLRRATILEVLRMRPVIDLPGRRVSAPHFDLGPWRIPQHHNVFVSLADLQESPEVFDRPGVFDPRRFLDARRPAPAWLAFGNGARRCMGADFALNEIDIVLRTVLQDFEIATDTSPAEKARFRGVTFYPGRGGRVTVTRRR
jgi:cytochrome P450 family 138